MSSSCPHHVPPHSGSQNSQRPVSPNVPIMSPGTASSTKDEQHLSLTVPSMSPDTVSNTCTADTANDKCPQMYLPHHCAQSAVWVSECPPSMSPCTAAAKIASGLCPQMSPSCPQTQPVAHSTQYRTMGQHKNVICPLSTQILKYPGF